MKRKKRLHSLGPPHSVLIWGGLLLVFLNCQFHFANVLPESPYRFGEYTCDPNAYYIVLGQIDVLRNDLIQRSMDRNLDIDYQAYKQAQKLILEKADVNKDKFVSTEEIYNVNMRDFKEVMLQRSERTAVSTDQEQPDIPAPPPQPKPGSRTP